MALYRKSWLSRLAARLMLAVLLLGIASGVPLPAGGGIHADLTKLCSAAGHDQAPIPGEPGHCVFCLPLTGAAGSPPDAIAVSQPSVAAVPVAVPDSVAGISRGDGRTPLPRGPPSV